MKVDSTGTEIYRSIHESVRHNFTSIRADIIHVNKNKTIEMLLTFNKLTHAYQIEMARIDKKGHYIYGISGNKNRFLCEREYNFILSCLILVSQQRKRGMEYQRHFIK
ncbi:MAG: hypothetical protein V1701_02520 [Planctomycetota bacterium]